MISNMAAMVMVLILFVIYQCFSCLPLTIISGLYLLIATSTMALFFQEKYLVAIIVHYLNAYIMTSVAMVCIGWDYGFAAYTFVTIIAMYYYVFVVSNLNKSLRICSPFAIIHLLTLCLIRYYLYLKGPLYPNNVLKYGFALDTFNWLACGLLVIYFVSLFIFSMQKIREQLEAQNDELKRMALYDSLTGFRNRQTIATDIVDLIEDAKADNTPFTLVLCDIDDFKHVNDSYGHSQGDKVLVRIASVFNENLPEKALICRWGGEEFLIALPMNLQDAKEWSLKIQHKLNTINFRTGSDIYHVTITFGLQPLDASSLTFQQMIQMADDHLYSGKHRGKNCVAYQNFIWKY